VAHPREVISNRESIIDQLELLVDELAAQRPWLNRISEAQLTGKALESDLSLWEMYQEVARKEAGHLATFSLTGRDESQQAASLDGLLDSLISARRKLVEHLKSSSIDYWHSASENGEGPTVEDVAFNISQSDAALLRAIAERLYESHISFSG